MNDPSYIVIGKIGSPYGVRGWIKVITYTEFGENILSYQPWYLSSNHNEQVQVLLEDSRIQGDTVLVKLKNIDTPEEAGRYSGQSIYIKRSQLPPLKKNEFYWSDLIGLTVINKEGKNLGKVIHLMDTGSNDVLVVKAEKEHGIPYIWGSIILNVDLDKKEITVDWEPII